MNVVLNFNFEAPQQLTAEVFAEVNCGHLSNLHVFFSL